MNDLGSSWYINSIDENTNFDDLFSNTEEE